MFIITNLKKNVIQMVVSEVSDAYGVYINCFVDSGVNNAGKCVEMIVE